jgi:hypothetical protein
MHSIQVDMFEVQLGAGMLLQFGRKGKPPIRVLTDDGVHASGYSSDHVHKKLLRIFAEAPGSPARIDLMIGTHYTKSH